MGGRFKRYKKCDYVKLCLLKQEARRRQLEADYAEALKLGEVPAAYARVMFLGPGGSGKSSLLDGLMNQPLRPDESTALADTLNIKYQWVEASDAAEDAWKAITEEDEVKEMATLTCQVVKPRSRGAASYIKNWAKAPAVLLFAPVFAAATALNALRTDWKYAQNAAQIHEDVTQSVVDEVIQQGEHSSPSKSTEVVMSIWDCGGQPVFLDILSAFLTQRTMFLLLFDASLPLNSKYQENWRHEGHIYPGKEQNITILQLMMQWMQLIHASLVAKKERGTAVKEAKQSGDRRQSSVLPEYPRIMIVGTHGDKVQSREQVLKELDTSCKEKAFNDLVADELIIDNTTAGRGGSEDPGYKKIRERIHKFTHSLTTRTPIAWVSFRKVLQKAVSGTPVLTYEQVVAIAETCGIPEQVVPSVLHFYHQLGVFLHYTNVKSLSTTIIAEPQWLIKQLCKLFMPEWYHPRPRHLAGLWRCLEGKGVLVEPLYQDIWQDCGLRGGAQALADLLEHFDLAKEISSVPTEMQRHDGHKYFVPCMLKTRSQEGPDHEMERMTGRPQEAVKEAATLHIIFNTEYIPPGFFVRLAARMTKNEKCTPIFERGIYRDSITFRFGEVDRVTISESKSLESVQVDFIRVAKRTHLNSRFADSCLTFRSELSTMCREALNWLPSIEHNFAFRCSCSGDAGEHFAIIKAGTYRESHLFCREDKLYRMDSKHKFWLEPAQFKLQEYIEDGKPTQTEIENVAKEIERCVDHMARIMDMEYSLEAAKRDPSQQNSPAFTLISDWAMHEKGTRYKLAEYLREAELRHASTMLLLGNMQSTEYFDLRGHMSLKTFSWKYVINALHEVNFADADWEKLGIQLNLSETQLANIRANHSDVESRLQEMIKQWKRSESTATREELAAALGRIYGLATAKRFRQTVGLLADNETAEEDPVPSVEVSEENQSNKNEELSKVTGAIPEGSAGLPVDVRSWTVPQVVKFFENTADCKDYASVFQKQKMDGRALLLLTHKLLMDHLGIELGPALKIMAHVRKLEGSQEEHSQVDSQEDVETPHLPPP